MTTAPNPNALERLVEVVQSKRAVVVAGAGVSIAATGNKECSSWPSLLRHGIDYCVKSECPADDDWAKRARADLEAGEFLDVASKIETKLTTPGTGLFSRWMKETVGQLERAVSDDSVPLAVLGLDLPIFTTNYDGIFERVGNRDPVTWLDADQYDSILDKTKPDDGIVHIHGHWRRRESIVLGLAGYQRVRDDSPSQAFLKSSAVTRSLVFVGCGGTIDDPNFDTLRDWLKTTFKSGRPRRHFLLAHDEEADDLQTKYRTDSIVVVPYGDHDDLADFIRSLAPQPTPSPDAPKERQSSSASTESSPPYDGDPILRDYREWARKKYGSIDLIGIGAGDARFDLEQVFIPLRLAHRRHDDADFMTGSRLNSSRDDKPIDNDPVEFDTLFVGDDARHVVILGDAGTGKTTLGKKILARQLDAGMDGLDDDTIPVFLRARRLRTADLEDTLERFVSRELESVSKDEEGDDATVLSPETAARLCRHRRLLLVFDGLDEIGDDTLRADACEWIVRETKRCAEKDIEVRFVASCRLQGWGKVDGKARSVDFGELPRHVEVLRLDAKQRRRLVHRWFDAAGATLPHYTRPKADRHRDHVLEAFDDEDDAGRRLRSVGSYPLLLSLLCVVAQKGGEIPRRRVDFYDRCLDVLLHRWRRREDADGDPLLELNAARALLRRIAWQLHERKRRDDYSYFEFDADVEAVGVEVTAQEILDWLRRDTGVFTRVGGDAYGFVHLGFQEYLAAAHAANRSGESLETLRAKIADAGRKESWWRETLLLFFGQASTSCLDDFLSPLLRDPALSSHHAVIEQGLREATEVDPAMFAKALEHIDESKDAAHLAGLLRLAFPYADDAVANVAARFDKHEDAAVRKTALAIIETIERRRDTDLRYDVFLGRHPEDHAVTEPVLEQLQREKLTVWPNDDELPTWRSDCREYPSRTRAALIVWTPRMADATGPAIDGVIRKLLRNERPTAVIDAGGDLTARGTVLESSPILKLDRAGRLDIDEVRELLRTERETPATPRADAERESDLEEALVCPVTGLRLLAVPKGEFEMGSDHLPGIEDEVAQWAQPIHRVAIDQPYWLGATPVTNAQYREFRRANPGQAEPEFWDNARFDADDQPVVGVSFDDAQAFCVWLSEKNGWNCRLPSEAQWERAARPDGRPYPWGQKAPSLDHAVFGLSWGKDGPSAVGGRPAGRGLFGHDDLAGNVWEWCADVFDEKAYDDRRERTTHDPLGTDGDAERRVVRGGAWDGSAEFLRSAVRSRYLRGSRHGGLGFRVCVVLPSR